MLERFAEAAERDLRADRCGTCCGDEPGYRAEDTDRGRGRRDERGQASAVLADEGDRGLQEGDNRADAEHPQRAAAAAGQTHLYRDVDRVAVGLPLRTGDQAPQAAEETAAALAVAVPVRPDGESYIGVVDAAP